MKCLSLWQPWATLMAIGVKTIETRSWPTSYRGLVAIQASKNWDKSRAAMCLTEPFRSALFQRCAVEAYYRSGNALPLGSILCVVNLDDCVPTERLEGEPVAERERAFGDYRPGRFGWLTSCRRELVAPVSFRAHQGLFDLPADVEAQVLEQLPGAEA